MVNLLPNSRIRSGLTAGILGLAASSSVTTTNDIINPVDAKFLFQKKTFLNMQSKRDHRIWVGFKVTRNLDNTSSTESQNVRETLKLLEAEKQQYEEKEQEKKQALERQIEEEKKERFKQEQLEQAGKLEKKASIISEEAGKLIEKANKIKQTAEDLKDKAESGSDYSGEEFDARSSPDGKSEGTSSKSDGKSDGKSDNSDGKSDGKSNASSSFLLKSASSGKSPQAGKQAVIGKDVVVTQSPEQGASCKPNKEGLGCECDRIKSKLQQVEESSIDGRVKFQIEH
jgi:hypothetical protein